MDSRKIPNWKVEKCLKWAFLKRIILSKEERKVIDFAIFRNHLCFFGKDMSDWTDQEIKEGVKNVADTIGKCGLSLEESARAMRVLSLSSTAIEHE